MANFTTSHRGTITNAGNAELVVEITPVPLFGRIERVRANVTSGTAINQVQVALSTVAPAVSPFDVVFSTGTLIAQPLDQSPAFWYQTPEAGPGAIHGSLFASCKVDDATTDHVIEIEVIIENLVSTRA